MLNWIVWNRTVLNLTKCEQKTVIIENWNFWNRTVYMHTNGFGIK